MRRQVLRLTLCALLNGVVAMAACAQQSSSRIDTSVSVERALTLIESASPDSNSTGAVVLLDAIRSGRAPSVDQVVGDLADQQDFEDRAGRDLTGIILERDQVYEFDSEAGTSYPACTYR